ncbi:hypothetical protein B0H13DRAFT_1905537 [Mycena leptocephala]|nr:hypothetical protein B0H13DRAFT_1905537 [Mycena leptocephala]
MNARFDYTYEEVNSAVVKSARQLRGDQEYNTTVRCAAGAQILVLIACFRSQVEYFLEPGLNAPDHGLPEDERLRDLIGLGSWRPSVDQVPGSMSINAVGRKLGSWKAVTKGNRLRCALGLCGGALCARDCICAGRIPTEASTDHESEHLNNAPSPHHLIIKISLLDDVQSLSEPSDTRPRAVIPSRTQISDYLGRSATISEYNAKGS